MIWAEIRCDVALDGHGPWNGRYYPRCYSADNIGPKSPLSPRHKVASISQLIVEAKAQGWRQVRGQLACPYCFSNLPKAIQRRGDDARRPPAGNTDGPPSAEPSESKENDDVHQNTARRPG